MYLTSDKQSLSNEAKWSKLLHTTSTTETHLHPIDYIITTVQLQKQQNIKFILATPVVWLVNLTQTHH